jgi:prophage maintenance system killer protein
MLGEVLNESVYNEIINANKKIVDENGEPFEVNEYKLRKILSNTNDTFNAVSNMKNRIILKTSIFISHICFCQPFSQGNKRTALTCMLNYLHGNGFTIATPDRDKIPQLFSDISFKFEFDPRITSDLEEYLINYIEKL